ncbi:ABC transporter substrate-binding protein [bacterium]|nr:ABC transporter substrate-binding protein [bacterium]
MSFWLGPCLDAPPQRIVCLVPSLTEWLWHLGLENRVVGITRFCVHPAHWQKTKTRVGGTKDVRIERVAALNPDWIIAHREENTAETARALALSTPVWISTICDLPSALEELAEIGQVCGLKEAATESVRSIETAWFGRKRETKRPRTLYLIWKNPWIAAGTGTFIDASLRSIGLVNALDQPRYPTLTEEDIAILNPERILLSSEPFPFSEADRAAVELAFPNTLVQRVNGESFSWYGARMLHFEPWWIAESDGNQTRL